MASRATGLPDRVGAVPQKGALGGHQGALSKAAEMDAQAIYEAASFAQVPKTASHAFLWQGL